MCTLIQNIFNVIYLLLLARALLSWVVQDPYYNPNPIVRFIYQATEPILAPFRRVIPPVGMFDISFIVAIIAIQLIGGALLSVVAQAGLCYAF